MSVKIFLGTASAMVVLLSAVPSYAHETKVEEAQTHELSGFDRITVAGVYHLDVEVGDSFSIETSGSAKDMAKTKIYVEDGVLVLGLKDKQGKQRNQNNQGVNAVVTLPALVGVEIAGVVTGEIANMDAKRFELDFAGVGELELSGECNDLEVAMAGIGQLDAKHLKCGDVNVELAGMGEASVYAVDRVDAAAAGMGQIDVYGNPEVVQKSSAFMSSVKLR